MICSYCNLEIKEKPTLWGHWYFHYKCYLKRTQYLQDVINQINITLSMKWFTFKKTLQHFHSNVIGDKNGL